MNLVTEEGRSQGAPPSLYVSKFYPRAAQTEALRRMEGRENFALFLAMRVGKTKVLLDDYGRLELAGKARNLMVIAPGGVYKTWVGETKKHLSDDLQSRAAVHVWQSGANRTQQRALEAFLAERDRPRIFLMNIEALSSVKDARLAAKMFLASGPTMLAIDESTTIKSPTTKRTKFIIKELADIANYRRILSGLPSPRSPLDLYSQFYFLSWKILSFTSYYTFRSRYAKIARVSFGGREVPLVTGYQNLEELQAKIAPHSFRVRLDECYDLPPKIYAIREVMLTVEQKRLYRELKEYATAKINAESHVTATLVISQILRLHQLLCGHLVDENGKFHEIAENRTGELIELLNEHEGKAIIWASYDADIRKLASALGKEFGEHSVSRFWGGNVNTREQEEQRFLADPSCRFMVATPAAGGRGRTWMVADLVVFYSNGYDLEARAQAEDRAQGVGKAQSVLYCDLVAPGTIDEKIIKALREKINLSSAVMGEAMREWLV